MSDKEYTVIEILDVLRRFKEGDSIRAITRSTGMDRNTVRKYIRLSQKKKLDEPDTELEDIAYAVFREVRNDDNSDDANNRDGILLPHKDNIIEWLDRDHLTLTKVHIKLLRQRSSAQGRQQVDEDLSRRGGNKDTPCYGRRQTLNRL